MILLHPNIQEEQKILATIIPILVGVILITILILFLLGERWHLLRSSTWKMMREGGLRRVLNLSFLHGYIYGRWTNRYVKLLLNLPSPATRAGKWLANHQHAKVLTQEQSEAIITIDQDIPLRELEQVIPYPTARSLVLKGPPDVVVYECACRDANATPCQPTQVCMVIGQPFGDFILEHHPQSSRRLTQSEALKLLREEYERGHLHSAWFKDAMLDRFYAICNCCKCCCAGIQAMTKYGIPMMASSGYVARVDSEFCATCGVCVEVCPFGAISLNETSAIINWEQCMGCGICAGQCPDEAMSLVRDEGKGIPMDVRLLAQE